MTKSLSGSNDIAALNRRAARFQREHEIERQKSSRQFGDPNPSSSYATYANSHLFKSRSGTPATYDADDPEANPVRAPPVMLCSADVLTMRRTCQTGIALLLSARHKRSSRTTCG